MPRSKSPIPVGRKRRYRRPDWADEFEAAGHRIAADGTIVVYHATTAAKAKKILEEGFLRRPADAPDSYGVYFSISPEVAENYGDGTLVKLRVPVEHLSLDDVFPSTGRMDFHARTHGGVYVPLALEVIPAGGAERGAEENPMGDVEKRAKAMQKRIVADMQKMTGPQHRIQRDGRFVLLTTDKDELLGAMDLTFAPPSSVYLALIVVLPEHRNIGYATLMIAMLTAAADMNMWTIKGVIRPWAGHGEAKKPMGLRAIRAWYRRLGFEISQDDEITRYPQGLMKPR